MNASLVLKANNSCDPSIGSMGVRGASNALDDTCGGFGLGRVKFVEIKTPKLSGWPREALVRVEYSSVNPVDWKTVIGNAQPTITGRDFSAVVQEVTAPCNFKPGDKVWGIWSGAYAEYMIVDCAYMGLKPTALDMAHAAALPLVALTGWMGLRFAGAPWSSAPTVLVLGGSGGTGSAGIQLAKANGAARIISTCSPENFDIVKSFGADEVIDYHSQNWWEVLPERSVDVIYDCVCLNRTGDQAYPILKDGGVFLTIQEPSAASPAVASARPSVSQSAYLLDMAHSRTSDLDYLKGLAESGQLNMPIDSTYELDEVGAAFESSMEGHTIGKISIHVR